MNCLKRFGERIMPGDLDRQAAEIHIRIANINRVNACGNAGIIPVT